MFRKLSLRRGVSIFEDAVSHVIFEEGADVEQSGY